MNNEIVKKWLSSDNVPQTDKDIISKMKNEELELAFSNAPLSFGTAGIRAKMAPGTQFLNKITYYQMATGYGKFLKNKFSNQNISVIVAHDNRNNGIDFSIDVTNILTSLELEFICLKIINLLLRQLFSYAIRKLNAQGAVIVTASHNPKEDNGFKIYNETGAQVLPDDGLKVVELMPNVFEMIDLKVANDDSLITYLNEDIFRQYYEDCKQALIKTNINESKEFSIVFSGQHGTACKRLPEFLKLLGYKNIILVEEQCIFDGNFSNTPTPNPENRAAWDLSIEYADKNNANVIIQVDPDADRFALGVRYKNSWRFLSGNQMGIIYTDYILKNKTFTKKPYIVSSYVSTNLIDRIIKEYHGEVYRVGTGFKWVGDKINKIKDSEEFVVGFEEAVGALNSTINRDKDAYQAAALALEIYNECLKNNINIIDHLEKNIYGKYGIIHNDTISFTFVENNWKELVKKSLDKILKYSEKTIGNRTITSIKYNEVGGCYDWILDGDSWLRFRMSGTEPKFKVYYNLYGENLNALSQEAKTINDQIKTLLNL
uniref:Phosphomannomutase n=1 Tax=Mycoplasmoides pirum TaxID=2122 RepID=MANB_MYCPI|nr:RecName: Full=Phosphomannomutase; Short=PMM [Mycoplasmoides pirum]AAA25434.1 phosphomannomutase [Mycoplasmoides pirum]